MAKMTDVEYVVRYARCLELSAHVEEDMNAYKRP